MEPAYNKIARETLKKDVRKQQKMLKKHEKESRKLSMY